MPKILVPLLVLCFAAVGAHAENYAHKDSFRHSAAFNADGVLTVTNVNGNVTVRAWDRNEILIEGEKAARTEDELRKIDLTMDVTSAQADLRVRLPKRSGFGPFGSNIRGRVTFTIHLPATARIARIETVNSQVDLEGLRGGAKVETVNGGIEARGLAGAGEFETVNGSIRANFATLAPDHELEFESVNGPITITLPPDASVDLSTEVVNGSVSCDFPLTVTRSSGRKHLSGTIGGGGAELKAETVNGSIRIVRSGGQD